VQLRINYFAGLQSLFLSERLSIRPAHGSSFLLYCVHFSCSSDYNLDKHELSESEAAPTMPYNTRKRSFSVVAEDISSSSSCIGMDALDAYNPAPAVSAAAAERCMETMDRVERKKSREKKRRVEVNNFTQHVLVSRFKSVA
jgi:hypothetical protein